MIGASAREKQQAVSFVPGTWCDFRLRGSDPRGACTATALSCKFEKGESAGQILGFDPRVSRKQPAGHDDVTRE